MKFKTVVHDDGSHTTSVVPDKNGKFEYQAVTIPAGRRMFPREARELRREAMRTSVEAMMNELLVDELGVGE